MLAKGLRSTQSLVSLSRRSIITPAGKAYVVPENLKDIVQHLDAKKPTFTCVYFHAQWNPICEKIEKDYDKFCAENSQFTHVKVDCDATPQVKFFFDARVEPQFLLLLNGAEARRQVGFNFDLMHDHCQEVVDFHFKNAEYLGSTGETWERFYDDFDRFDQHGNYDRDAMRMQHTSQADTWRGPGSI